MVKKHTIKDVAKEAGVSIATVSFVLNATPGQVISIEVQKKVKLAAKKLDYHPSASASGLARKHTSNLAVVFYRREDLISNQYYSFVVQGAIKEAMRQGFNLLFSYIEAEYAKGEMLPKVVREKNAEGCIFIHEIDPQLVRDIESRGIKVTAIDNYPDMENIDSVSVDNVHGGLLVMEHLAKLGHKNIGIVFSADDRPSINGRLAGYRQAAEKASIKLKEYRCGSLTFEDSFLETTRLLSLKSRPTAVVCINDEMAAGAVRAVHSLGLHVPNDVSIVGFDNITMSNYTDPPLTTVGSDKEEMGARAVRRLHEMIREKKVGTVQDLLSVELIVRESTGPAPAAHKKIS
jgi:DNA-binding LacI/PurR family transcriptional regulator